MARGMAGALLAAAILGGVAAAARGPQGAVPDNPFLGKWDITATTATGNYPYWLEVREDGGKLVGYFQGRGGAVARLPEIAREGAFDRRKVVSFKAGFEGGDGPRDGEAIRGMGGNQIQGIQFASVGGATLELIKAKGLGREFPTDWLLQDVRN